MDKRQIKRKPNLNADFNLYPQAKAMSQLKLKTSTVSLVDYGDLERFIQQAYDLTHDQYEFAPTEEVDNDSYKLYRVKPEPLDEYDQRKLNQVKAGKVPNYCTSILLQDLCNKGWLEPGEYLVHISW